MTHPKTPWDLDIRVRERNLKKGTLDAKELDKSLKDLPDVSAQATIVTLAQPAFSDADDGLDDADDEG